MRISKGAIERYLSGFSKKPETQAILKRCLLPPLLQDNRYFKKVESAEELPSNSLKRKYVKLKRRFGDAAYSWYVFQPNSDISEKIKKITSWFEDELASFGEYYEHGCVREAVQSKLEEIRSIEDLFAMMDSPLLDQEELTLARQTRKVPTEELNGDFEFIGMVEGEFPLYRMTTSKGMVAAGEAADNCFKSTKHPRGATVSYRYRVRQESQWMYFQMRDPVGRSCVNYQFSAVTSKNGEIGHWKIKREGNGPMNENFVSPIADEHFILATHAEQHIIERYALKMSPEYWRRRAALADDDPAYPKPDNYDI